MNADERRFKNTKAGLICVYLFSSVVPFLLCAGCQQLEGVGTAGKRFVDFFSGKTPINAAKRMEDQYFPDERRIGIAELSNNDFGRREPYTTRYEQIAQVDTDWMVRATAIRALNRSRDGKATPLYIRALSDENPIVRVEACKALANMPDQNAVPVLLRLVANADENHDVRIWAADALHHYRSLEVARTLANQLGTRDFGVAWQARRSLVTLTGNDLRYDESAWLQYLTGANGPFG